jgi:hypothetical protein
MRFVTLGPEGSCHEHAVRNYLSYHSVSDAEVVLIDDLLDGLEMVRNANANYLVQCSAHLNVHLVTERYHNEIVITDTFIFPTKEMALLERSEVSAPVTLGLVRATEGYLEGISYPHVLYEVTKPVVGENLLAGKYDAGITYLTYHTSNPGRFRMRKYIGTVLTTWIVYGRGTAFTGPAVGIAPRGFYSQRISVDQAT